MKKIQATTKIFAVTAVFTLALCFAVVKAYDAPYAVGLGMEGIKYAQFKHTDYYTKNVLGDQSVNMMNVFTSLTNPCPKCKIGVKPFNENGDAYAGISLQLGEEEAFVGHDGSSWTGNYRLGFMREDFTLLNTTISAIWYLNREA